MTPRQAIIPHRIAKLTDLVIFAQLICSLCAGTIIAFALIILFHLSEKLMHSMRAGMWYEWNVILFFPPE
jgi:Mn2+/Fe2+ NRAMP family transporter